MLKCTNTLDNRAKWGYTCAIAKNKCAAPQRCWFSREMNFNQNRNNNQNKNEQNSQNKNQNNNQNKNQQNSQNKSQNNCR